MKKKISLFLASIMLFSSIVIAADNDGWTEAPNTNSALNGKWEQWCENWEVEKNNWENISLTPGANETELNFAWYSKDNQGLPKFRWYEDEILSPSGVYEVKQNTAVPGYKSNKVSVKNVKPNTTYFYSYTIDGTWSEPVEYKTSNSSKNFSFVFFGDPQIGSSNKNIPTGESEALGQDRAVRNDSFNWNDTVEKAYNLNPNISFMVSAGDQIQTRDKKTSSETHLSYTENEIEYAGYLSPKLLKQIPVATTIGNHDALSTNYTYHFNNPNSSNLGSTYAGGNYHFSYGDTLFIMLNTNNKNVAEHSLFIKNACMSNKDAKWKIVTLHQDIYGSGEHSNEPEIIELRYGLIPAFEENKIDVVLTGHDHTYSRSYIMKGGSKDDSKFITEEEFEKYLEGEKELDSTYSNYLESIEDKNNITSKDTTVYNPDGILYITANSASGSKYYDLVEHQQAYIASRWQEDVPTFSMIDINDNKFTINTYRTDTMEKIDNEFTIIKNNSNISEEISTETTTTYNNYSSGSGSSNIKVENYSKTTTNTTESFTETTTENTSIKTANNIKVQIGSNKIQIDDKKETIDVAPYIQSSTNSTMVPLRFTSLAILNDDVNNSSNNKILWDPINKIATIKAYDTTISFKNNSNIMKINNIEFEMENNAKAEIKNDRFFIPFRALAKALNVNVSWDNKTKTATYSK